MERFKIVKSICGFGSSRNSRASANVKYAEGVMVFTMQKGGLMYEASVGGQQFKFTKALLLLVATSCIMQP
jgi:hypothetical protein